MYISHCLGVREGIQGHISVCIYTDRYKDICDRWGSGLYALAFGVYGYAWKQGLGGPVGIPES